MSACALPMRRLVLPLLLLSVAHAAEEDFAFDEGYGEAVSAVAVFEPETGKPSFDMRRNKEVKIPPEQRKRRTVTMVFSVSREGGEPRLEPVLKHEGALEFWVLKGVDARALRKALPEAPCYVKLTGARVLEKWYSGGFAVKGEHGRLYSFFPERPVWVKAPGEMEEIRSRIDSERSAASSARAAGRFAEALDRLKALEILERDWPAGIPPEEGRSRRTLEALLGLEKGGTSSFLLEVAEGLPASRYDFDQSDRIRELLLKRMREASPETASGLESRLLAWFRERYKDRAADTACLDLAEMLSLVGGKISLVSMDDYLKAKILPGPWKDDLKERFSSYVEAIRARAKAQTP